ncbi:MAG: hypothetical protein FIB04_11340 [Gammaproteobacteria bacterium]|nr:hypothetical protein [Gammaproteobacteria bacterium]
MDDLTRKPRSRPRPATRRNERLDDPAGAALTELIDSERARVTLEEPGLAEQADPGRVWLLWFAIGATEAVCRMVERETDAERNSVFRQVVSVIFGGDGVRSAVDPVHANKTLIELFESAGAGAVEACMRGEKRLGYYLEALRVSLRPEP